MKIKWYESRDMRTGETLWWTQRDRYTNCYEIRVSAYPLGNKFRLYINETFDRAFNTLSEAEANVKDLWAE